MAAHPDPQVGSVQISETVGRLQIVRPDGSLVRPAWALGISLGD